MIEVTDLTKKYGQTLAVDGLSFTVAPGRVTGFLGPNGAGKSTTMRMILGLDRPTKGHATVGGVDFNSIDRPLASVGALLDAGAVHGARSGYNHLLALAQSNGLSPKRVDVVLDQVGLTSAANRRVKGYSLGMRQRLGVAAALLGEPEVLMFDEPVNGLDPEGILWIRNLLKSLAAKGHTVFVSSHLMSEMALTAEHLIVIGRGRLIADMSVAEFIRSSSGGRVIVRAAEPDRLAGLLYERGASVEQVDGRMVVTGADCDLVGDIASAASISLRELRAEEASLETAFMELTGASTEFSATVPQEAPLALEGSTR